MWRCLNYIFGYCTNEPEQVPKTETETFRDIGGKLHYEEVTRLSCAQNPETCGKFRTCSQLVEHYKDQHPSPAPVAKDEW